MTDFLGVHMLHQWSKVWVRFDDEWRLRGINECCGKFAGLIDSELEELVLKGSYFAFEMAARIDFCTEKGRGESGRGYTALSRNLCCSSVSGVRRLVLLVGWSRGVAVDSAGGGGDAKVVVVETCRTAREGSLLITIGVCRWIADLYVERRSATPLVFIWNELQRL